MRRMLALLSLAVVATACGASDPTDSAPPAPPPDPGPKPGIVADLRGDSNRDGDVRFDDSDADRTSWSATSGAVFLANIDDDLDRCKKAGDDVDLEKCNDAADDVINGPDDVLDLARLKTRPWPEAPETATATIAVTPAAKDLVRLFKRTGEGPTDFEVMTDESTLSAAEIRSGVELAIEARDIVRDPAKWDGLVDVKLTVSVGEESASDEVRMRVAPVMTYHHLLPAEQIWVSDTRSSGNRAMRRDLAAACTEAGVAAPTLVDDEDPWTQDFFETAFMSMPGAGGKQHAIRVNLRSANVFEPSDAKSPLRPAGQIVFTALRGKDSAGVQQFDRQHDRRMDSLNSFGNLETIPPYTLGDKSYPFGRILRGRTTTFYPDRAFTTMLDGQKMQPSVDIDTSWLMVGHVDETLSFVKAPSARGWVLLVNDPTLAKTMLEEQDAAGNGAVPMFSGKQWFDFDGGRKPAEVTIAQVLADTEVMSASAEAAAEVDGQVAKLKAETGLTEAEIIRIPYLHTSYRGLSYAYVPGTVNGIYIADGHFVAPDPHGPVIEGKDIFRQAMTDRLRPLGITAHFAEDWDAYHAGLGEVHCGSNATRKIPETKWWEAGR